MHRHTVPTCCGPTNTHARMHACARSFTHTRMHAHAHSRIHTRMHAYTHARVRVYRRTTGRCSTARTLNPEPGTLNPEPGTDPALTHVEIHACDCAHMRKRTSTRNCATAMRAHTDYACSHDITRTCIHFTNTYTGRRHLCRRRCMRNA